MASANARIASVRELFSGPAYSLDHYQRAYSWDRENVLALCKDLKDAWRRSGSTERTPEYFLGAVVTQLYGARPCLIIDGQQRLTTLALLIARIAARAEASLKSDLRRYTHRAEGFVIDVEGYAEALREIVDTDKARRPRLRMTPPGPQRLSEAWDWIDIELAHFSRPEEAAFCAWLLDYAYVALIEDTDPYDSQVLFDRINTRGQRLSEADKFRSQVLTAVAPLRRMRVQQAWTKARKTAVDVLSAEGPNNPVDAERMLLQDWLIGRKAGTGDHGVDLQADAREIVRNPYNWVDVWRDEAGLTRADLVEVLESDFFVVLPAFAPAVAAEADFDPNLSGFRTAAVARLPLVRAGVAAVVHPQRRKTWSIDVRVLGAFLDCYAARLLWRPAWQSPAERRDMMGRVIEGVRGRTGETLAQFLTEMLAHAPDFDPSHAPSLEPGNRPQIRYLLARLTDHVEKFITGQDRHRTFFHELGATSADIEHLMGDSHKAYERQFPDAETWWRERNRIGALAILPRQDHMALREKHYEDKLATYRLRNQLVAALSPEAYAVRKGKRLLAGKKHADAFTFAPFDKINRDTLDAREQLYAAIAERTFDRARIAIAR